MNELVKRLLATFQLPEMTTSKVDVTVDKQVLKSHVSRKRVQLPAEDVQELCNIPDAWMYPTDISGIIGDLPDSHPGYIGVESSAEYIGGIEKFYPYVPGVRTAVRAGTPTELTIYGANRLMDKDRRPAVIAKHIGSKEQESIDMTIGSTPGNNVPVFEFQEPTSVIMTAFTETKYEYSMLTQSFMERCNILAINLPYDYYHYQPMDPSTYTLDEDDGKFRFCDMDSDLFLETLYAVYKHGVTEPVVFTIDGDVLIPFGTESNINLFIAKLLKLPTIPALIVAVTDASVENFFMKGMLNAEPNTRDMVKTSLQYIRHTLMPYIAIVDQSDMENDSPTFDINGTSYQKSMYRKFMNHGTTAVYFLATDVDNDVMTSSEQQVQEAQKELNKQATARWEDRMARIRAKLNKLGKDG